MKSKLVLTALVIAFVGGTVSKGVSAATSTPVISNQIVLEHGGGCRKSSPPGKCCHGGKQPYHCH